MPNIGIGNADNYGFILRRLRGPVELWESPNPNGGFTVGIWVTPDYWLHAYRKERSVADDFFNSTCLMLAGLPPEES